MTDEGKEIVDLLNKLNCEIEHDAESFAFLSDGALALLRAYSDSIWEEAAKVCDGISEAWSKKRVMTQESVRERDGGTCAAAECGDALRARAQKGGGA